VCCAIIIIKNNKKTSLILLNVNAFIADFNVFRRNVQKLINKKDVKPISSQPKNITIELSAITSKDILKINQFINNINRSVCGSFLK
jgi:hypothetical protein